MLPLVTLHVSISFAWWWPVWSRQNLLPQTFPHFVCSRANNIVTSFGTLSSKEGYCQRNCWPLMDERYEKVGGWGRRRKKRLYCVSAMSLIDCPTIFLESWGKTSWKVMTSGYSLFVLYLAEGHHRSSPDRRLLFCELFFGRVLLWMSAITGEIMA